MKISDEVLNALQALRRNAENDFELHRINVLERDLTNPPRVEVIDDKHQRFNGVTFRKRKEGHYFTPCLSIYKAVWLYHYGEVPPKTIIHHRDHNKANNNIENLIPMLPADHRKHHGGSGEKLEVTLICQECGATYTTGYSGQKVFRCPACREKHEPIYNKNCAWCGKEFQTKNNKAQYCSPSCAQRDIYFKRTGKTAALIERTCVVCGKIFMVNKSHRGKENPDRITCSDECLSKYRGLIQQKREHPKKPPKICPVCGKEFYPKGHHSRTKTCSPECGRKLRNPNTEYIIVKCEFCGKEISCRKSHRQRFCSQDCVHKYMAQVNTKHGFCAKEVRKCAVCGKEFTTTKSSQKKFCSQLCKEKSKSSTLIL